MKPQKPIPKKRSKPRVVRDRAPRPEQDAVKVFPSGREVCQDTRAGVEEYHRRKVEMWLRDLGKCCICGGNIPTIMESTFEHKDGRGMGSARRDDRPELNGVAHFWCNTKKGSKRDVK